MKDPTPISFEELLDDDLDDFILGSLGKTSAEATGVYAAASLLGQRLKDEYTLIELISESGSSAIYKAKRETSSDANYQQFVAVKVFYPIVEKIMGETLLNHEAQILANCRHYNIVKVLTITRFFLDGFQFSCLIMEYVSGSNLLVSCFDNKTPFKGRLKLFHDVCQAVSYLHSRPIVHGDLKPENILIDDDGSVKVVDFTLGVTNFSNPEQTHCITKSYASPNQLNGKLPTVACDVYALGRLLEELINGRVSPGEILPAIGPIRIPLTKNKAILSVISKATAECPDDRYLSVESFGDDIYSIINGYPIQKNKGRFLLSALSFLQRQPVWSVGFLIILTVLTKTYYDKSKSQAAVLVAYNELSLANANLKKEYLATVSVTKQLSNILRVADLRYSKGQPISAFSIVDMAKNIPADQTLPLHFRFNLFLQYGDSYLGNGNIKEAISNYSEAYQLALQFSGKLSTITEQMLYTAVTKLSVSYFEANQPLKARNIIEPYVLSISDLGDISQVKLGMLLAYFKINGIMFGVASYDLQMSENLDLVIYSFLNSNTNIISADDKARLALEYANAMYYSFEGGAFSITDGKTSDYIEKMVIPTMQRLDVILTKALGNMENTNHLYPEIASMLAKVKFEQGFFDIAIEYGQLAVRQAETIYQSISHPSVQKAYTKYFTVIINRRSDLIMPLLDKMFTAQRLSENSKLGLMTALASSVWYSMGMYENLADVEVLYNDIDITSPSLGYIEQETIGVTSYNIFSLQSLPYPAVSAQKHIELFNAITLIQYGDNHNIDPIAIARIRLTEFILAYYSGKNIESVATFAEVIETISDSGWPDELFIHFASIYASLGYDLKAIELLNLAKAQFIHGSEKKDYSARMLVFQIGLAMVYSKLNDGISMDEHLDEAIKISQFNGFTSGVHIASIKYLQAYKSMNIYREDPSAQRLEDFYKDKNEALELLRESGAIQDDHPIRESLKSMNIQILKYKNIKFINY